MVDIERGNGEWGILRFRVTSHSPAKFQNSPANSPSVKMSSTNENVRGMGNGKRDLTHSKLTTPNSIQFKKKHQIGLLKAQNGQTSLYVMNLTNLDVVLDA